jgi:WD40 repeat protein
MEMAKSLFPYFRMCMIISLCFTAALVGTIPTAAQEDPELHYMYSIPLDSSIGNFHEIAWSPDGNKLALGGGGVFIYSLDEHTYVPMEGYLDFGGVATVAWSPDGTQLAGAAARVTIWDAESGEVIREVGEEYRYRFYTDVAWTSSGEKIAATSVGLERVDWAIRIWDASSFNLLLQIQGEDLPTADSFGDRGFGQIALIPSEDLILATSWGDDRIHGWDATNGRLVLTTEAGYGMISVSENTHQLAVSTVKDKTISIWDILNRETVNMFHLDENVQGIAWNPKGNMLAVLGETHLYISYDRDELKQISEVSSPVDIDWSSDGNFVTVLTAENILFFRLN